MPDAPVRRRRWIACALWAAACVPPVIVYWRTMAPGLLARGDTPKLQYLGAILGTAHAPGYPLFVCLSWVFSQLPIASVAWRVTFMTMLFAVLAAGVAAWAARACGAGRAGSLLTGLGLAFGPVFWAQATAAEVYTLAALLQAAAFGLIVRWQQTRRDGWLLAAAAVSALALGHHPTFVLTLPAFVLFVLATDWRVLTRGRLVSAIAAMTTVGLAQYLFILLRTHQGAPYLEAQARTLGELVPVIAGRQFHGLLFQYSLSDVVHERAALIWRFIADELPAAAMALAAIGLVRLLRRNWRAAALLLIGGLACFAFACTYSVADIEVFVITVFLVGWILAGVGLTAIEDVLPWRPALRSTAALLVTAGLATLMITRSYAHEDLSGETYDGRYMAALFDQIETPAALLFTGNDATSHAARYQLYAEQAARGFVRIGRVDEGPDPAASAQGRRGTYVFAPDHETLARRGLLIAPVTLEARLTDRLTATPRGAVVAFAIPAGVSGTLSADDLAALGRLGAHQLASAIGYAGIARDGRTLGELAGTPAIVRPAGGLPGGLAGITAEASLDGAAISLGTRDVVHSRTGAVIAAIARDGTVLWTETLARAEGIRPAIDMIRRPLYRAVGPASCRDVRNGEWAVFAAGEIIGTRITSWVRPSATGAHIDAEALVDTYAVTDETPATLGGIDAAGADLPRDHEIFDLTHADDRRALSDRLREDNLDLASAGRFVARVGYPLRDGASSATQLVSPRPRAIAARVRAATPVIARFCAAPVLGEVLFGDASEWRAELMRNGADSVGGGWTDADNGADPRRWTVTARADVRFTLRDPLALMVSVTAAPAGHLDGQQVRIVVNGTDLASQPLTSSEATYDWQVPAALLRPGYNEIALVGPQPIAPNRIDPGAAGAAQPQRALSVRGILLTRVVGR